MSESTKPKRKRTKKPAECVSVRYYPPKCPKCGSTKRSKREGIRTSNIRGVTREGVAFTKIVYAYVTCRENGCNQRYCIHSYHNE